MKQRKHQRRKRHIHLFPIQAHGAVQRFAKQPFLPQGRNNAPKQGVCPHAAAQRKRGNLPALLCRRGHQQGDKIGKVGKPQHAHQPRHGAPGAHRPARRARPGGHGAAQPGKGSGRGHAVKRDVGDKPHAPATLHKLRPNGAQQRRAQHCAHLRGQQKRSVCPGRARNTRAKRKLHPGRPLSLVCTPCACGYVHHTRRRRTKQPKRHKRRVDDAMHPNFGFRGNVFYVNTPKALPFLQKHSVPWRPGGRHGARFATGPYPAPLFLFDRRAAQKQPHHARQCQRTGQPD